MEKVETILQGLTEVSIHCVFWASWTRSMERQSLFLEAKRKIDDWVERFLPFYQGFENERVNMMGRKFEISMERYRESTFREIAAIVEKQITPQAPITLIMWYTELAGILYTIHENLTRK